MAVVTAVKSKPEPARRDSGPRRYFMYHDGRPPRFAQLLSVMYTSPNSAAWMPAACWTGRIIVGNAARHGHTLQMYLSAVYFMGVSVVIARPQCTPPRKERMVAP